MAGSLNRLWIPAFPAVNYCGKAIHHKWAGFLNLPVGLPGWENWWCSRNSKMNPGTLSYYFVIIKSLFQGLPNNQINVLELLD